MLQLSAIDCIMLVQAAKLNNESINISFIDLTIEPANLG